MEEQNLIDLIAGFAGHVKALSENPNDETLKHDSWKYSVDRANGLSQHFVFGEKPKSILERMRPREDDQVRDYRIDSYEPITYSFTRRVMNYLQRVFNPELFQLSFTDADIESGRVQPEDSLRSYLTEELPAYGSLVSFLRDFALERMMSDPNGYVVLYSDKSDAQLFQEDGPDAYQKPYPKFVPSCDATLYRDHLLVLSDDKSPVLVGNKTEEVGNIYFVFLPGVTGRFVQVGKQQEHNYEFEVWNSYPASVPLFMHLGGKPTPLQTKTLTKSNQVIFDSHIQPAVPYLNKWISLDSDQSASFLLHVFLQRWEAAIDCPDCSGTGRIDDMDYTVNPKGTPRKKACETCKGAGTVNGNSVFKKYIVHPDKDGKLDPTPPGGFIAPPTEIIDIVEAKLTKLEQKALESLNMGFLSRQQTGGVESAEAKRQEKDALNTMLETVRKDIDRIGEFIAMAINLIMFQTVLGPEGIWSNAPSIAAPRSFEIESAEDTAAFAKEMSETPGSQAIVRELLKKVASQRFGERSQEALKVHAILSLDPFFGLSTEDIADLDMAGDAIRDIDIVIHTYIGHIVDAAIEENPDFLSLSRSEQFEKVEEIAGQIETDGGDSGISTEP